MSRIELQQLLHTAADFNRWAIRLISDDEETDLINGTDKDAILTPVHTYPDGYLPLIGEIGYVVSLYGQYRAIRQSAVRRKFK